MNLPRQLLAGFVMFGAAMQLLGQTNTSAAIPVSGAFLLVLNSGVTNVFVQRAGANVFDPAYNGQTLSVGDRLQTRANGRVVLRLPGGSDLRLDEYSDVKIKREANSKSGFSLVTQRARIFFFHRGEPEDLRIQTRTATAAVRGTEFDLNSDEDGNLQIIMLDGEVVLGNELGEVVLQSGQQGVARPGELPVRTAVVQGAHLIQWWLYYPAILDLNDLEFSPNPETALRKSFSRYQAGDLVGALDSYPTNAVSASVSETIYYSALLLSVGRAVESASLLERLTRASNLDNEADFYRRLVDALLKQIRSVQAQSWQGKTTPVTATEWLAESYHLQSKGDLPGALDAARRATLWSPRFGFAWARVAELEFGFARNVMAADALEKALKYSPRNAQALALQGFTRAARNKLETAIDSFNQALSCDPGLGNAWLGRGLCRIRLGDLESGVADLQMAVVVEPQRAVLRSYLGKAYAAMKKDSLAAGELGLAMQWDPGDPTAWLYLALLNRDRHKFNTGIRNLEQSITVNESRQVYRSRFLLDQDRAVRSASLASLYREAGMSEVGQREAVRAVSSDYANYSAHLFLAQTYDALRDPTRFNLRYETPWFSELLLANLLSPVGGTPLSQNISQHEYARLFDQDHVGLSSTAEYRSDGQIRELASQTGNIGLTAWALDWDYQHNDGVRPNNGLDRLEWYTTIKQQLTSQDSVLVLAKYQNYHSGDNFQYYNSTNVRYDFSFDEHQMPILMGGYHHEWSPGNHTLLFGGRLENKQRFSDKGAQQLMPWFNAYPTNFMFTTPYALDVEYRNKLGIFSAEGQQILNNEHHSLVFGGRWQSGTIKTHDLMTNPGGGPTPPAAADQIEERSEWFSGYLYETLKLPACFHLTGGVAYEHLSYPENFRAPPVKSGQEKRTRLNPKAGLVFNPTPAATFRIGYAKSLGGISLDESYRLEPTQVGGFTQSYRTVIPESLVGSVAAPDHEIFGSALDLKFKTGTYIGLQGTLLNSRIEQTIGAFDVYFPSPIAIPSSTRQHVDYEEKSLGLMLNQLISTAWSLGAHYSFTQSELISTYPAFTTLLPTHTGAELHQFGLALNYNSRSGFFARAGWTCYQQSDSTGYNGTAVTRLADETFDQFNIFLGYRLPRQRGDFTIGVLNATGTDYRLNPVTTHPELPRKAVLYTKLTFRF
jgi:tetratricopeptide (TPR) repeat protein